MVSILVSLAIMFIAGFFATRLTRLIKLPDVTGYILVGILIGPYVLKLIPSEFVSNIGFISDMAMALIAFSIGEFFIIDKEKINAKKVIIITLCESFVTLTLSVLVMWLICGMPLAFSFLLGSIACATAPASTIMTIRQYKAHGKFVTTLLKVIAIDGAVAIFVFHICLTFVTMGENVSLISILLPILYNIFLIALGILLGFIMAKLSAKYQKHPESRMLLVLMILMSLTAICGLLGTSPLLTCMALGIAYTNFHGDTEVYHSMAQFSVPIMLLFFVYSGMNLDITKLATLGLFGLAYFVVRIIGKGAGAYLGGTISKSSDRIKKYIGLALIPQAGISIGLATLAQRVITDEWGVTLSIIIMSSAVLYEIVGPISAKWAIFKSDSIPLSKLQQYHPKAYLAKTQKSGKKIEIVAESEQMDLTDDIITPNEKTLIDTKEKLSNADLDKDISVQGFDKNSKILPPEKSTKKK